MAKKKQGWSMIGITARVIMLLSAAILALSYVAIVVNPAKAWYFCILGILFVPLLLLNLVFLIWALCKKSSSFIIPLVVLLPSLIFIGRYFRFASGGARQGKESIKIMTYNVGQFILGRGYEYSESLDSITTMVRNSDADIVCMQEFNIGQVKDMQKLLEERFPGYFACYYINLNSGSSSGNVTLSKFPIESRGHFDFENSSNLAIYTDIMIGEQKMRIYNCHFQSYSISLPSLARNWRNKTVRKETENKMKTSIIKRSSQVEQVLSDIENCPVESIVTGDFNDTPMSYTYHRLRKGKKDAFVEAGSGFGATYSFLWPLIRIDYILYPRSFKGVSYSCRHVGYSDHYPIMTAVNLPE
jgi:endonuclease/exonuclease/phosphatase family metal-dependent hydrolase